ncbi:MAG: tRNA guanosine(34) transglycosylase Tgt [Candidatus Moranbacteria bacterium]|nr:tRNA guanosine(34) transglycosylase Tgt [Candidatus Moranbacteria bacterium]
MLKIISHKNGRRIGKLETKSGAINTPFFMPDATRGFAKSLGKEDLEKIGVGPMVVNTYHLYLQPGIDLIKKAGGINKFMNWEAPLLSDSGGYQIFSLIHKNPEMGKITDDKVIFKSPLDGKEHEFTPEEAIQIQFDLGVDMMVVLDDCPPNSYPKEKIEEAVKRTIGWAKRCKEEYNRQLRVRNEKLKRRPLIFGVIQGGTYKDLRKYCAEELIEIGFDGLGFGARHHDEKGNLMEELLKFTANLIPENYLRFALGVGTPEDIVQCAVMGWDIFDCVIPTREGRHGKLFIWKSDPNDANFHPNGPNGFYETVNINNEKFKTDLSPVDEHCDCELCQNYSRAYLSHLFKAGDPLAMRLATIHNLRFYLRLMKQLQS